ncbi:hypothetical protein AAE021_14525 [Arthrobacter citreus]|uniref:Small acid-soluble spore protein P n=1 Tax=Arthrobacter citreus TaxID=1670 RepID=A0ABZ2ZT72_9MICC
MLTLDKADSPTATRGPHSRQYPDTTPKPHVKHHHKKHMNQLYEENQ